MSGHVGDLSVDQEKTLAEFKEIMADVHRSEYDDYFYLRWLRARNFDKGKAEVMLRKNLIWRKNIGVDTILNDYKPPEVFEKFYPRSLLGADKEGCPVRYLPFRFLDFRGFALSVTKAETVKYTTYLYEQETEFMKKQQEKLGKHVQQSTYIVDMEGYMFRQATNKESVDILNCLLKVFEANYPERLKIVYFINVPVYFSMALALSKPFISEVTLKKFKLFNKDGFQEFLFTVVDADVLPKFLGGNRTDPDGDPLCKTIINYGGFVPKSFYFSHGDRKFAEEEGVKSLMIDKRSCKFVDVEVCESGSRLQWEVVTSNHDIGIGLYYRKDANDTSYHELEEILPVNRVNCHLVPESCTIVCNRNGTYVLKFDNAYSWFFSKKVLYKVTVITPNAFHL